MKKTSKKNKATKNENLELFAEKFAEILIAQIETNKNSNKDEKQKFYHG